jgi:hypothetical protein
MFEEFANYRVVLVTGPQRSGTTITAQMIAYDTGHRYVDEFEFSVYDDVAFDRTCNTGRDIVVQCPGMLRRIVDCPPSDDVLVVMIRRALEDIRRSERRIRWECSAVELARLGRTSGDAALLKYEYWDQHKKPRHWRAVAFQDLIEHPLFLPRSARSRFLPKQTTTQMGAGIMGLRRQPYV